MYEVVNSVLDVYFYMDVWGCSFRFLCLYSKYICFWLEFYYYNWKCKYILMLFRKYKCLKDFFKDGYNILACG